MTEIKLIELPFIVVIERRIQVHIFTSLVHTDSACIASSYHYVQLQVHT